MKRLLICCHARADADAAREIAAFLEANCPIEASFEEAVGAEDFLEAAERALTGDIALLLMSAAAVARPWTRNEWEPVLVEGAREAGAEALTAMLAPCPFPALLRRKGFFDFAAGRLGALRTLKRHLLGSEPERHETAGFEELRRRIADRAGVADGIPNAEARAFAEACGGDFEAVIPVDGAHRSEAGLAGDLGEALGMRLRGRLEDNLASLRRLAAERRCLFVFEHLAEDLRPLAELGGRSSLLIAESAVPPAPGPIGTTIDLFSAWTRREPECLRALGEAQWHLGQNPDPAARAALARSAAALLLHRERLAEAWEMLDALAGALDEAGDALGSYRARWEQSWILEQWGERAAPPPSPESGMTQLALPF